MDQVRLLPEIPSFRCFNLCLKRNFENSPKKKGHQTAFLPPSYLIPLHFRHPISGQRCAQISATIFSFFGKLRFHVLKKLSLKSLVLVGARGKEHKMNHLSSKNQEHLLFRSPIIGFYFNISDKFHPVARAYYPKLSDTNPTWSPICPLRALKLLWGYGLLQPPPCQKARLTENN